VLGHAPQAIERFLAGEGLSGDRSEVPLEEQVKAWIYDHQRRARYVAAATRYLKAKQPTLREVYDVVLVGAGLHAAIFVYIAKLANPGLKALIVEKSDTTCATFAQLGDALVLNSPTFSKVGLNSNVAQGHFIQVSDFDELAERPFPTAKHLHELATMILFHADADIVFDFSVEGVNEAEGRYTLSSQGRTVEAQSVVVANGMGEQRKNAFKRDQQSSQVVEGDHFIAACHDNTHVLEQIRGKTLAIVGAGDSANCVMEYLLPLTYPNNHYRAYAKGTPTPSLIYWIGQSAESVQDFYFANKQRYCHSGGLIEFFWDGEAPFDLPAESWQRTKAKIQCIPDKLTALSHKTNAIELTVGDQRLHADIVVDCTGRNNPLSTALLQGAYEFVSGDVVFYGGQWDELLERFVVAPRTLEGRRIACQVKNTRIFLLGCACPVDELIDDEEALDGSLKHQEERKSLTNSKLSLEHTLPRTAAFAAQFAQALRAPSETSKV